MERRIWGLLVFPKLRSTNACSFLACPYGFDCHTLHDSFFQTKIPEDSRREISQCKSTTFEEREKCTEDVHRHRVNIRSMLAAQHHLLVPSLLCIRHMTASRGVHYFIVISILLRISNCAINPCICCIFSGNYRQGLKNLIRCCPACNRANQVAV